MHRMPGLPSSNLSLRTLTGDNDMIGPEDIFNGKIKVRILFLSVLQ